MVKVQPPPHLQNPSPTRYTPIPELRTAPVCPGKAAALLLSSGAEQMKGIPGECPQPPSPPWDLDKECLGDQKADTEVLVSRRAEKLACVAAKPTAPVEGRMWKWGKKGGQ